MTDMEIKNAKPKSKPYFLSDSEGLRLLVSTNGSKIFQFRYTYLKQRKIATIGTYPLTSLLQARKKTLEFKELLLNQKDPQRIAREEKYGPDSPEFQIHKIYERWYELYCKKIKDSTAKRIYSFFENRFLPYFCKYDQDRKIIGSKNINEISHQDIIDIIIKYEKKSGSDLAGRLLRYVKKLWGYAFSVGLLQNNSISNIAVSDILSPISQIHYPKITDEKILGELLRCIDSYHNSIIIKSALQFVALVPLRSGNLCKLKWSYVNWEKQTITIPRSEMKIANNNLPDFKLPLSDQALVILKEIQVFTGWGEWIFHAVTNSKKPMVGDSLVKALRIMGFNDEARGRKQLVHSFRGTFRSLCDTYQGEHNTSFEIKEAALDHHLGNKVTQAYNHKADYTEQIRPLLQWWADFLDRVKVV